MDARNLLTEPWRAETLRPFFGDLEVKAWFNGSAPAVKSGVVKPDELTADEALALMVAEPLLIRRPLMEIEGRRLVGFDQDEMARLLGVAREEDAPDLEACPRQDDGQAHEAGCKVDPAG